MGSTRYSPPTHPSHPTPRVHLLHAGHWYHGHRTGQCPGVNHAVGLKSVAQLTLRSIFLDLRTITEGYNLVRIKDR